jgi:hypothetical protein
MGARRKTSESIGHRRIRTSKSIDRRRSTIESIRQKLVGQRIAKLDYMFDYENHDNEVYFGTIVSCWYHDNGTQLFEVDYDDGDDEDIKFNEVQSVLRVYEQNRHLDDDVPA